MENVPEGRFSFTAVEPLQTLSENMTPDMLLQLFGSISDFIEHRIFDGMIIAHGTDTLAYTAQLANLLLSGLGFPVVILGSKKPLDDPMNDGQANFLHALELISQVKSGVYVVSRSCSGTDYVHSAGMCMQADSQTDDFHSYKNNIFGTMEAGKLIENPGFSQRLPAFNSRELLTGAAAVRSEAAGRTVLLLDAAVGMQYQLLDLSRPEFTFIIQRLYHSGTACTVPHDSPFSLLYLQDVCRENSKRLFIAPIESERTPYSTTCELLEAGITPAYDFPVETVWAVLLICTWLKKDPEEFFTLQG